MKHLGSAVLVTVGLLALVQRRRRPPWCATMRATAGEPKRDTRIPQMRASASILTIGRGDPTISIGGGSTRAADTGGQKVPGSSFRELRRLSPLNSACVTRGPSF